MSADRCPTCGARDDAETEPLVAACDLLVFRALELLGKRIVTRPRRGRWEQTKLPWAHAHLFWQPDEEMVDSALSTAWDPLDIVLVEYGCCGATPDQLRLVLDRYVRDLVQLRQGHDVTELRYRLSAYLGVPA